MIKKQSILSGISIFGMLFCMSIFPIFADEDTENIDNTTMNDGGEMNDTSEDVDMNSAPENTQQNGKVAQFEIIAPTSVKVSEALDVTIRALDKDKNVVKDYRGAIIFVTDYMGDILPAPGNSISFTAEDAGEKKFSKGVIFKKTGKRTLYVSDSSENNIEGEVTITVEEGTDMGGASEQEITILTPEKDGKISGNTLLISGKTRKNSRIELQLNGTNIGIVTSDDSGLFTKEIKDISQEKNILVASLLDANNTNIATTGDFPFSKIENTSSLYGITIMPATTVVSGSPITLTVEAPPGLPQVAIMLDNSQIITKEQSEGKYVAETRAPQEEGKYPLDVEVKSITNESNVSKNVQELTVVAADAPPLEMPRFRDVKTQTKEDMVLFQFSLENTPANLKRFRIMHGTGASALDSQVTTQDADKILRNGIYSWYIPNLTPNTSYTFKIYGEDDSGALIDGLVSDPLSATIGAPSCTISNVGEIRTQTDTSKSTLSWEPVVGANGYNIYTIDADGKYTLFQQVQEPRYTIFLSKGSVEYKDFGVKALCANGEESQDYSQALKVKTGPGMIAFLVIVSGIIGFYIVRRKAL